MPMQIDIPIRFLYSRPWSSAQVKSIIVAGFPKDMEADPFMVIKSSMGQPRTWFVLKIFLLCELPFWMVSDL